MYKIKKIKNNAILNLSIIDPLSSRTHARDLKWFETVFPKKSYPLPCIYFSMFYNLIIILIWIKCNTFNQKILIKLVKFFIVFYQLSTFLKSLIQADIPHQSCGLILLSSARNPLLFFVLFFCRLPVLIRPCRCRLWVPH